MEKNKKKELRSGYSTGTYSAAACASAWINFSRKEVVSSVSVVFPDRVVKNFVVDESHKSMAMLVKDAGDDPDITNGARIYASVKSSSERDARPEDYVMKVGSGTVILRASGGIGLCTREGLDCSPGKWAINIVPRKMICDSLRYHGFGDEPGCIICNLSVENGEELAMKTLNPLLGIKGGISILGTSGIVHPYSNSAYVETIRVLVKALVRTSRSEAVFSTGGRTLKWASNIFMDLHETSFIIIGDFISDSLCMAKEEGIKSVTVACMPGKLCKYAAGNKNTHAHRAKQNIGIFADAVIECFPGIGADIEFCNDARTIREAMSLLNKEQIEVIMEYLAWKALNLLSGWAVGIKLRLIVFNFDGDLLADVGGNKNDW